MFDFGAGELLVIGIVALVVIGPKELPGVLRQVGKATGKMRQMAGEFRSQFDEAMREAELHEATKHLAGFKDDIVSTVTDLNPVTDIKNEIHSTTAMLNAPLAPAEPVAPVAAPAEAPAKPKRVRKTAAPDKTAEKKIGIGPGIVADDAPPPVIAGKPARSRRAKPNAPVAAEVKSPEPAKPPRQPAKLALVEPSSPPAARSAGKKTGAGKAKPSATKIVALTSPPKAS